MHPEEGLRVLFFFGRRQNAGSAACGLFFRRPSARHENLCSARQYLKWMDGHVVPCRKTVSENSGWPLNEKL